MQNTITLISKPGCHLCAELLPVINELVDRLDLRLEKFNILEHPDLEAKYSEFIPVVLVDGIEVGHLLISREQIESAIVPRTGATSAAFFDLDNTVIRGSSLWHLGRGLVKQKFVSGKDLRKFFWKQLKFVVVGKETVTDMDVIRKHSLQVIEGKDAKDLEAKGLVIAKELLLPKVFHQSVGLAKDHLSRGEDVWLVTASPRRLAQLLAKELGFTGAIGSEAEIIAGKYTGELNGEIMHGPVKAKTVKRLAEQRRYDLARCTAYSDSFNDVPLLEVVGNAVVVNGDRKLRNYGKAKGWKTYDFRRMRLARKHGINALSLGIAPLLNKIFRKNR
jgi:HAD superfamily hydrolase (TIGR01490 family)